MERRVAKFLTGAARFLRGERPNPEFQREYWEFVEEEGVGPFLDFSTRRVLNWELFWRFVSEVVGMPVSSLEQLERLRAGGRTRRENQLLSGNSKLRPLSPFATGVVLKLPGEGHLRLYPAAHRGLEEVLARWKGHRWVAVENGESLWGVTSAPALYLGGYPNRATSAFGAHLELEFFVDWDFHGVQIFEKFQCRGKELLIPPSFEPLLRQFGNRDLYWRQWRQQQQVVYKPITPVGRALYQLFHREKRVLEQEIVTYSGNREWLLPSQLQLGDRGRGPIGRG